MTSRARGGAGAGPPAPPPPSVIPPAGAAPGASPIPPRSAGGGRPGAAGQALGRSQRGNGSRLPAVADGVRAHVRGVGMKWSFRTLLTQNCSVISPVTRTLPLSDCPLWCSSYLESDLGSFPLAHPAWHRAGSLGPRCPISHRGNRGQGRLDPHRWLSRCFRSILCLLLYRWPSISGDVVRSGAVRRPLSVAYR